ncbi:hypothetical protein [Gracilibacillus saliphilus]|uniref:hypothetical protein n=1 Tax=Gracilibacillus saliphilus TaxID=543890 RepID=UPI0013D0C787|nr:hypothetical protein [Gracilibacillus saliphilus]
MRNFVLNMLSIITFSPLITEVTEMEIEKNIRELKKYQWFNNLLVDERYRSQIIHDKDVRETIGKFNVENLDSASYQKKLQKMLRKKVIN